MREVRAIHVVLAVLIIAALTAGLVLASPQDAAVLVIAAVFVACAITAGALLIVHVAMWRERPEAPRRAPATGVKTALEIVVGCLVGLPLLMLAGLCMSAGLATRNLIAGIIGFGIAFVIVLYLGMMVASAWTRRRATARVVIGQLATVVRQNLPLATGVSLAGESESGAARAHLSRIAHLLGQGAPLSKAVRFGYPDCPSLPLSLIIAGEQAGRLPSALDQAEEYLVETTQRHEHTEVPVWPYLLIYCSFLVFLVAGLMVAVVPKFKEIFKDFGAALPRPTVILIDICTWVGGYGGLLLPLVLVVPLGIYFSLRPRRVPEPAWTSRLADWVRWYTPGVARQQFGSGMATVLRTVRFALGCGMGLDAAVRLAAEVDVNTMLRPRIRRLGALLAEGAELRRAVRESGLGEVAAVALAAGQRSADIDGALRYAAEYHEAIGSRWWAIARNLCWPAATLTMGCFIGFIILAMFTPLVTLIYSVCQ